MDEFRRKVLFLTFLFFVLGSNMLQQFQLLMLVVNAYSNEYATILRERKLPRDLASDRKRPRFWKSLERMSMILSAVRRCGVKKRAKSTNHSPRIGS